MQPPAVPPPQAIVTAPGSWLGLSSPTWLGIVTIIAIVLGPILALWAQRWSEPRRETRQRRLWLFRELMATRSIRLSGRHVEALNLIDLEFDAKKANVKVLDAWKLYLDSLSETPPEGHLRDAHFQKREDFFVDLMFEMGQCLGFSFNKVAIKRNAYSPIAHGEIEDDIRLIRKGIVELLSGKRGLSTLSWLMPGPHPYPVQVIEPQPAQPPVAPQAQVEAPAPKQPLIEERARPEDPKPRQVP